ncbi:VCBS domain-containing protein [Alphaproteobacteria bacterium]|nr:VCBS domain-containing protein [Alphaproteobacteria bacterium]
MTGTYGQLTLNANGSYTYVANTSAANALDAGDTVYDYFNYTLSDGRATDTATITITVTGVDDDITAVDDYDSVSEGSSISRSAGSGYDIDSDDTDPDDSSSQSITAIRLGNTEGSGTAGSIGQALTGTYGQLTLNANGSYTYAANQDAANVLDSGDYVYDYFNYTVTSGSQTDTAVIRITVYGVNDAPVAANDTNSVSEGGTVTVTDGSSDIIDDNDTDVDASSNLRVASVRTGGVEGSGTGGSISSGSSRTLTGTYGTLVLNSNGSYTYTADQTAANILDAGDTVTDVFNYTLTDGSATDIATITITVNGVDDDITAVNDFDSLYENATISRSADTGYDIDSDDTDPDASSSQSITAIRLGSTEGAGTAGTIGQALTGTYGQLTLNSNGSYTYAANQAAAEALDIGDRVYDYFNYTVTSGSQTDTAVIIIMVTGVNDAPVAANDTGSVNEGETLTVTDGSGDIIENNDTDADASAFLRVSSVRTGGNEGSGTAGSLGSALTGTYGQLTLNANGSYTYVANQDAANALDAGDIVTDVFNYTLTDGRATDTATITITINGVDDDITAVNDTDAVNEGSTISRSAGSSYDIDSDDTDPDASSSQSITSIRLGNTEGSGTAGSLGQALTGTYGQLTLNANGSYSYVANQAAANALDAGDAVVDYFNYTVTSGSQTDTAVIAITVNGVNDAPVANNDTGAVNEDATLTVTDGSSDLVEDNDTDADASSSLTVTTFRIGGNEGSGTEANAGSSLTGTYGTLTINANGSYTYVADQDAADALAADVTATDVFNYTISDGSATDIATLTITITGVDDGIVAVDDTGYINEDATLTVDDTNYTVTASGGNFYINSDQQKTLNLLEGSTYIFTYPSGHPFALSTTANGSHGGGSEYTTGVTRDSSANTLTFVVPSSAPQLYYYCTSHSNMGGTVNTPAPDATSSGSNSGDIQANDTDADDATPSTTISAIRIGSSEGSGTAGTIGQALTGTYGQLTLNANGSYSYAANQSAADALDDGDTVTDIFNYTISDGSTTDTGLITITIIGINDDPVAANDTGTVNEGETLTVSNGSSDIIDDNDTDADASASLTVSAVRLGGVEGSGDAGTIGSALTGTYGQLTLNANGSYTYVANQDAANVLDAGDTVTDVFNYTLSDGTATDIATITITINGVDDDITAVDDTDAVNEGATISRSAGSSYDIDSDDTDPDASSSQSITAIRKGGTEGIGVAGTIGSALTGTYGQLTLNANGSYSYVANQDAANALDAGATATDVFNYTVTSGSQTDTALITITVTGVDDDITAVDDTDAVNEDATISRSVGSSYDLDSDDNDPDTNSTSTITAIRKGGTEGSGDAGTIGSGLTGTYGTLTVNANGSYTYVADQAAADALDTGDTVTDVFNYTVTSGSQTDTAVLTITVTGINDAPVAANDTGSVNEGATLTVSNGSSDIIDDNDTDADASSSLSVSAIRTGGSEGSGTAGSIGAALTGTYGQITLNADGSYTYVANQDAANALDANDQVTDVFNYTLSDGTATDTATITITITGVNDAPSGVNDTGYINEDATLTVADGGSAIAGTASGSNSGDVLANDTDPDASPTLTLTGTYSHTGGTDENGSLNSSTSNSASLGSGVLGTYGTLTLAANGSYTYAATTAAADALGTGDRVTDVFTYTVTDENSATSTATITITVIGQPEALEAVDDTDAINAGETITVSDGDDEDVMIDDTSTAGGITLIYGADTGTASAITNNNYALKLSSDFTANGTAVQIDSADAAHFAVDSYDGGYVVVYQDTSSKEIRFKRYDASGNAVGSETVVESANLLTASDYNGLESQSYDVAGLEGGGFVVVYSDQYSTNAYYAQLKYKRYDNSGNLLAGTAGSGFIESYRSRYAMVDVEGLSNGGFAVAYGRAASSTHSYGYLGYTNFRDSNSNALRTIHTSYRTHSMDLIALESGGVANFQSRNTNRIQSSGRDYLYYTWYPNDQGTGRVVQPHVDSASSFTPDYDVHDALELTNGNIVLVYDSSTTGRYFKIYNPGTTAMGSRVSLTGESFHSDIARDGDGFIIVSSNADSTITGTAIIAQKFNADGSANGSQFTIASSLVGLVDPQIVDSGAASLNVSAIRTGQESGSGTSGSVGSGLTGTYGTLTIAANGSYTYAATTTAATNLASGTTAYDYFTYTVSDGTNTDTAQLSILVTGTAVGDPTAVNDTDAVNAGSTITVSDGDSEDVLTDDTDPNSLAMTVTAVRLLDENRSGTSGTVGQALTGTYGQLTLNANGSYTYNANQAAATALPADAVVTDVFTYTVTNSGGGADVATLTITITGINDAPVAVNDTDAVNEDATIARGDASSYDVESDDTDADTGASLTVDSIRTGSTEGSGTAGTLGSALTGTYGTLTMADDGSYTYVADQAAADALDAGDTVTDVFNYTISDGTATDTALLTITVTGVNDDPVATNDTGAVNEGETLTVSNGSGDIVENNDTDADDSSSLTVTSIRTGSTEGSGTAGTLGAALTGTYGQITVNANGSYTYVANQDAANALDAGVTATDVFNYTISDGTASDTATITITITGVDDDITAVDDTDAVNEDATITRSADTSYDIDSDDTDPDTNSSSTITAIRKGGSEGSGDAGTIGSGLTGTYGTLTMNADGSYSYVADQAAADALDAGDTATDVFNYTVTSGSQTDTALLTITVTGINDAPVAANDTGSVNEDATLTAANGSGDLVEDNDTDLDPDAVLTITEIRKGSSEGSGTAGTVGSSLTGTYGTITVNSDGSYTYVADQDAADALDAGDTVTDTFNYTLSDGTATDTATITITITGVDDDITAVDDTDAVDEDGSISRSAGTIYDLDSDDSDPDEDDTTSTSTITAIRTGSTEGSGTAGSLGSGLTGTYGTLTVNSDGSYSYVADQAAADDLDLNDTAIDYFNYTVTSGSQTDIAVLAITVTGINDAPVAANDTGSVDEDATLTVSNGSGDLVENNDTDPDDSSSLVISAIRVGGTEGSGTTGTIGSGLTGTYGTITVNANGSYTYVADQAAADALDAGDTVTDVFNYTLSDGTVTDTATITITITGVDDDITAVDDTDAVNEDATISRSVGDSQELDSDDVDLDDSSTSTITGIRLGNTEDSGTAGTIGSALTGTYGTLTVNANGSYTYVADQTAADALDAGDTAIDYFNYTVTSGSQTDTAVLAITVTGINDAPVAANDTGSVNEGETLTVSNGSSDIVEDNDSDADDSSTLTVTAIRIGGSEGSGTAGSVGSALTGTYGTLTLNANGSYSYVADQDAANILDAGDSVTDVFNYTVSDGTDTDTATLTITVTGVDDDITAVNDTDAVNEDATISRSVGDSQELDSDDTDPDDSSTSTITGIRIGSTEDSGVAGTIGSGLTGTYGTLTVNANGSYTYVADQDAADALDLGDTAIDYFNYTVTSGSQTDTAVLAITVTGLNDDPVATNDTGTVNEGETLTVSNGSGDIVEDNDTDADDSSTLTVTAIRIGGSEGSGTAGTVGSALTGTYGQLTLNANGSYSYVANQDAADALDAGDTVTDVFNYTVSDGTATDMATITITVNGVDDDITAVDDTDAVNEDATISRSVGDSQELDSDDTDPDDSSSSTITGIRLGSTEDSGTAGSIGSALTGTYGTLTVNANGSYTYVADQTAADALDAGDTAIDYFNYTVTSGSQTDTAVLAITVTGINDAPVASNDTGTVNEGETLTVSDGSSDVVEDNDSDADDSSTLTVTSVRLGSTEGSGTAGTIGSALTGTYGQLTLNANGSYTYVANQDAADALDAGDTVTDVFNYTISSGTDTDTATITITVNGVDDDITAVDDTDIVNENATISRSVGDSQELDSDDTDPDDSSSSTITGIRLGNTEDSGVAGTIGSALTGTYGTLTVNANGSYTYAADQTAADALDAGDTAIDYFNYTVTSGSQTDTAVLAITVTGLNDAPVAANDTGTVNEGETLSVSNGSSDIVEDNDTDADDSAALNITEVRIGSSEGSGTAGTVGSALTGTYGQLTLNANGSYTYVANQDAADALDAGDTVTDIFNYTVSDGTDTDMATITITVNGVDDDITAVNDTDAVVENASISRSVNTSYDIDSNDTDPDDSSSSTITGIRIGSTEDSGVPGTIGSGLVGTYGTLTLNANGSYSYAADQSGADALDAGDTAIDYFNYTVTSGSQTDTAAIAITVTGINDAPVAVDDTDEVLATQTITRSAGSSYDIDSDDTDLDDSSSLTITAIRLGSNEGSGDAGTVGSALVGTYGTLTVNANGSYSYAADQDAATSLSEGSSVTDVFNYTVSDGTAIDTGLITITVSASNAPPVAVNDTGSVDEGATLTVADGSGDVVEDNDTDANSGDTLTITHVRTGSTEGSGTLGTLGSGLTGTYGTLTLSANGSYTYVADQAAADALDAGDTVTDVFNYTVSDGSATDMATITITVNGINDAPVAVDDTDAVNEDATITRSVGDSQELDSDDTDADDSSSLTITAIRTGGTEGSGTAGTIGSGLVGTYGTLTVNADGSYSYVADQAVADALDDGDTVTDVFNYTVSDGTDTDTATLTITVTGVDDDITAVDDTDTVVEGASIARAVDSEYDIDSDDVDLDESSSSRITAIRIGGSEGSGDAGTLGSALTGTYGQLTMRANGSYFYIADQTAANALAVGETATDVFNYTVTSGSQTDTALLTITITGENDAVIAIDDTDAVDEDATITRSVGDSQELDSDDTDDDTNDTTTIVGIATGSGNSTVDGTVGSPLIGTYGTLTVNADGSYTYSADQDATDELPAGVVVTDVFTYTVSDGTATDTATLTITVTSSDPKNNPVAVDNRETLTAGETIAKGTASAGVIANDTDNGQDALTVGETSISAIRTGRELGSGDTGKVGTALIGTYGTLTINSDGSYTYTADTAAAERLVPNQTRSDVFTYTLTDGTDTDEAELHFRVKGKNDAPTSTDMATVRVMERQKIALKPGTFFSDPDNPNTTYGTLKYFVSDLPEGLTVNENNGNIVGKLSTEGTYTFTITAIDGGGLTTQETITIIVGKPIFKEREKVKLPKIKITPQTINELVQTETVIFNEFEALPSANSFEARVGTTLQPIVKDLSFNGGMKVVDVAVDDTKAFGGDNDGTIVGFAVGDDYRSNVKQYTGVLDNGQALPEWVKIDRTTGQTLVQFPEGQDSIDIRLVAVDKDNTTRQINLTLNKEQVENDPTLRRDLNEFVDRSASLKTEVTVNNQGQVELLATENSQVDQSRSANLNAPTNLSAPQTEPNQFDNSFTNTNSSPAGTLKLAEIEKVNDLVRVKITDDNRDNVRQYSAGFANGTPLPQWIQVNSTTGEVQATPPAGIESISFKIFAEDENGDIRSIDVDLDFAEENDELSLNLNENENSNVVKFASLNDQIQIQSDDYDEYGERLVKASS